MQALRSDLENLRKEWQDNDRMTVSYTLTGDDASGFAHIAGRDPDNAFLFGDYADIFFDLVSEIAQKHGIPFQDDRSFRTSSDIILSW